MHNDECRSKVNNMSDRNTGSPTLAVCMSDIMFGKEKNICSPGGFYWEMSKISKAGECQKEEIKYRVGSNPSAHHVSFKVFDIFNMF